MRLDFLLYYYRHTSQLSRRKIFVSQVVLPKRASFAGPEDRKYLENGVGATGGALYNGGTRPDGVAGQGLIRKGVDLPHECPICGAVALSEFQGEFRFEPPDNIPGGVMVVPNASWQECQSCGERILPHELDRALDDESRRRQGLGLLTPREIREIRVRRLYPR